MKTQERKQIERKGDVCLTLRRSNKVRNYYQLGYYLQGKWMMLLQLGTPEKIYDFYCDKLNIEKKE